MKPKALMNLLPILAIAIVCGSVLYQQWQRTQATRPDYDDPSSPVQPTGIVDATDEIQVPDTEVWQVVKVTDGDTITVEKGNKQEKIRFCGIDAPESTQPLGAQSQAHLQQLITQANYQVGIVPVERDRYGRLVAEVFVLGNEEKFLQQEMLTSGMAYVYEQYVGGCWNGEAMKKAEAIAQENHAGVWSGDYQKPWDYRSQQRAMGSK